MALDSRPHSAPQITEHAPEDETKDDAHAAKGENEKKVGGESNECGPGSHDGSHDGKGTCHGASSLCCGPRTFAELCASLSARANFLLEVRHSPSELLFAPVLV